MDRNKNYIFILINQFHHFLRCITVRNTHQSGKASHTMIGMYHIISRCKLIQLFQTQSDLATTCFITFEIIFMKTVE